VVPILIPGLVQTADYARALFLAEQTDISDEAIGALVAARLERQAILDRAGGPTSSPSSMRRCCTASSAHRRSCTTR